VTKSTDTHFTLGGYGVVFGGVDLEGETFTKDTDFWIDKLNLTPLVLYQHGQDRTLKRHVLSRAEVAPDDVGLWVESQIALSDRYAEALRRMADEGRLGWSSGAIGH
jgi:phage head maturation protease